MQVMELGTSVSAAHFGGLQADKQCSVLSKCLTSPKYSTPTGWKPRKHSEIYFSIIINAQDEFSFLKKKKKFSSIKIRFWPYGSYKKVSAQEYSIMLIDYCNMLHMRGRKAKERYEDVPAGPVFE